MRILTAEAMREVDRQAIEEIGIPSLVLMENAAAGVVEAIEGAFPAASRVAVLCGPGNNGGDGLAVARHLAARGVDVAAALLAAGSSLRGDAARQLRICSAMGLGIAECCDESAVADLLTAVAKCDLAVDALFGTGLARPLEGRFACLVEGLNGGAVPVVAIDVPSGLAGSSDRQLGPTIDADLTVALGAPKVANLLPPAATFCGRLVVADLGIPPGLIERAAGDLRLLTADELAPQLAARAAESHKGDYGHVLVVGGSVGKSGAAVLAARGALRIGAGLVSVAVPEPLVSTVEAASVESMTVALAAAGEEIAAAAEPALLAACEDKQAVAFGPGAGRGSDVAALMRRAVAKLDVPVVLDADALNAFAGRLEELVSRSAETILTPHAGELGRLLGVTTEEVLADRLAAVRRACVESGSIVVLKGHRSLIADPLGGVYVNPTGNPGMASGGTGDVLTGMVLGLLGQGHEGIAAATLGVFLHGAAGDRAAAELGERGLTAGDLLVQVPAVSRELAAS